MSELRLPAVPVREILKRAGVGVTPDAVDTGRSLAETAMGAGLRVVAAGADACMG